MFTNIITTASEKIKAFKKEHPEEAFWLAIFGSLVIADRIQYLTQRQAVADGIKMAVNGRYRIKWNGVVKKFNVNLK